MLYRVAPKFTLMGLAEGCCTACFPVALKIILTVGSWGLRGSGPGPPQSESIPARPMRSFPQGSSVYPLGIWDFPLLRIYSSNVLSPCSWHIDPLLRRFCASPLLAALLCLGIKWGVNAESLA